MNEDLWYRLGRAFAIIKEAGLALHGPLPVANPPVQRPEAPQAGQRTINRSLSGEGDKRSPASDNVGQTPGDGRLALGGTHPDASRERRLIQVAVRLALRSLDRDGPPPVPSGAALARAGVAGAVSALVIELVRVGLDRVEEPQQPPSVSNDDGKEDAREARAVGRKVEPANTRIVGTDQDIESNSSVDHDERSYATVVDRVLDGAARGIVYRMAIEPRAPGPAVLKGAVFAVAEHATLPVGGLTAVLPDPGLSALRGFVSEIGRHEPDLAQRVAFGVAVALICR